MTGLGGLGALALYEAVMWAVENVGPGAERDLEKLIDKRMKEEGKAQVGADLYEAQGMELDLAAQEESFKLSEGLHDEDLAMFNSVFGGTSDLGGGSEQDQAIAMMDSLEPGLADRVAQASKFDMSPLAFASGYRPEDRYAV